MSKKKKKQKPCQYEAHQQMMADKAVAASDAMYAKIWDVLGDKPEDNVEARAALLGVFAAAHQLAASLDLTLEPDKHERSHVDQLVEILGLRRDHQNRAKVFQAVVDTMLPHLLPLTSKPNEPKN